MTAKKIFAISAAVLMILGLFAACSKQPGKDETPTTTTTVTGESNQEGTSTSTTSVSGETSLTTAKPTDSSSNSGLASEKGKNLKLIRPGLNPKKEDDPVVMAVKEYEKKYNAKVDILAADYDSWQTKVLAALTSGQPIDVIYGSVSEYPLFAAKGYTQPLSKYVDLTSENVSQSGTKAYFSFRGEIYCAASATISPLVMYYNKDMLEEEGIEDPIALYRAGQWTFAKFREICMQLTGDTTNSGKVDRWGLCAWYPQDFLGANATSLCKLTDEGKFVLNLDDPAVMETLNYIQDMTYKSNWLGLDGNDLFTSWAQGRNAFFNEYAWQEAMTIVPAKQSGEFDFEYGVAPMPIGPNNKDGVNVCHSSGFGIGTGTANPYHAGELINIILKTQKVDQDAKNKKMPKAHVDLYEELTKKPFNNAYFDSAISQGTDLMGMVTGGNNIQTAIAAVRPIYQGKLEDANDW